MKIRRFQKSGLGFWLLLGLLLIANCSPSTQKGSTGKKVGHYQNPRIGLSVEYDAEKLDKAMPAGGMFVFMRQSSQQYPMMAISAGPFPPGGKLKDVAPLIAASISSLMPGSKVHGVHNQKMITLSDQTLVNYFEVKWNSNGIELATAFVAGEKGGRLITVSVSDRVENPIANSAAMVKTLKLNIEVDEAALRATGFGKDGHFVRTDSPAFSFDYPREFQDLPLAAGLIFRAGIPQGSPSIEIAILPLKPDEKIEKQLRSMADRYVKLLTPVGSDFEIISDELIDNYKEFPACHFEIVWKWQGRVPITSVVHAIAKENQIIHIAGHTAYEPEELLDIYKTIKLHP